MSLAVESDLQQFEQRLFLPETGLMDPDGVHHLFVDGMHGQKAEFSVIKRGMSLYRQWVKLSAQDIKQAYEDLPEFILGVANGTNAFAEDVAAELKNGVIGLRTEKAQHNPKIKRLTPLAEAMISFFEPELVAVVDDAGTTGSSTYQVAEAALDAGAQEVVVQYALQRSANLPYLDKAVIAYTALVKRCLPNFTSEQCEAEGFCAKGWELLGHGTEGSQ